MNEQNSINNNSTPKRPIPLAAAPLSPYRCDLAWWVLLRYDTTSDKVTNNYNHSY